MFPEPGTSPDAASFGPVRSALRKQLVSHFRDALDTLTNGDLYQQLLQLPAVAVGDLLRADDFGTDSEDSSIFLLLTCWLAANEADVSEEARIELCKMVRLHRLRSAYLNIVLPTYQPFSKISRSELGFLLRYAAAGEHKKKQLL